MAARKLAPALPSNLSGYDRAQALALSQQLKYGRAEPASISGPLFDMQLSLIQPEPPEEN